MPRSKSGHGGNVWHDRAMSDIPRIISVDDHVVEPPDLWSARLPAKYRERGPRVERDKAKFSFIGGVFSFERGVDDGEWCDFWLYDDLVYPFPKLSAAIGFPDLDNTPVTFDEIRPGCWKQPERLQDMADNHVDASICFPNVLPRFAGQTFMERNDKDLALECVKVYNDWMIDEWCAGDGQGQAHPAHDHPAVGRRARGRRGAALRRQGQPRRRLHREPVPARAAVGARQERVLGAVLRRAARDRHDAVHAHRVVVEDAVDLARLAVHRVVDAHVLQRDGLDVRLHLLGDPRSLPHAEARLLARVRPAGRRTSSSGPTSCGRSGPRTPSARRCRIRPSSYIPGRIYFCIFDDEVGLREPQRGRHGADHVRGRLPARRQHVPAHQGDGPAHLRQGGTGRSRARTC